ncbi:MAG: aminotransferase class V-fold PLP-dependent enzyme [Planctomycetota bacterium]|nr:aminotransferase class V-fold PLP-dependent enzyme [Planctomycetota bacterium]
MNQANEGNLFNNALMSEIRDRFVNIDSDPFSGKRICFENAGGTLRLKSIFKVIETYTELPDNTGRRNAASRKVNEAIDRGRKDIALFVGAVSGTIAAEQSTTGMIFRILNTIAANASGGNMVTTNLDHASCFDATRMIAQRCGMEFRCAELDPKTDLVGVESILKHIDEETVVLTVIHASNIIGSKNDVTTITAEARKKSPDIFVVLDGAQHASHGMIDVEEYGADAWIFVPYKTYSKAGASFAWMSDRLANLPHDNLAGKPKDMWDLGTREAASYACMSEVSAYFQWLGSKFTDSTDARQKIEAAMLAIDRHEAALLEAMMGGTDRARGMLDNVRVTVYGDKQNLATQETIIAFNVEGMSTADLVDYFEDNSVRLHNRISDCYSGHTLSAFGIEECVRVSLCHYNTLNEVSVFLKLLERVAN